MYCSNISHPRLRPSCSIVFRKSVRQTKACPSYALPRHLPSTRATTIAICLSPLSKPSYLGKKKRIRTLRIPTLVSLLAWRFCGFPRQLTQSVAHPRYLPVFIPEKLNPRDGISFLENEAVFLYWYQWIRETIHLQE